MILLLLCPLFLFSQEVDVLALSSLVMDSVITIDQAALKKMHLTDRAWQPIDHKTLQKTLQQHPPYKQELGGSGINVLFALSNLGRQCAILGRIGSDTIGKQLEEELQQAHIISLLQHGPLPTGHALCFVTETGSRAFSTYLGASHSTQTVPLHDHYFQNIKLFHVEGYQMLDEALVEKSLQLAKKHNCLTSLNLVSARIVKEHKKLLIYILPRLVDILFCNQEEAYALTHLPPKQACKALAKLCRVVVVFIDTTHCFIAQGNHLIKSVAPATSIVDTTAAEDLFAAGFLHNYLQKKSLHDCASFGHYLSSFVMKDYGVHIDKESWEIILEKIGQTTSQ